MFIITSVQLYKNQFANGAITTGAITTSSRCSFFKEIDSMRISLLQLCPKLEFDLARLYKLLIRGKAIYVSIHLVRMIVRWRITHTWEGREPCFHFASPSQKISGRRCMPLQVELSLPVLNCTIKREKCYKTLLVRRCLSEIFTNSFRNKLK